jgi:hypothetical protein
MNKRTDIHRPSAIIPEDYMFVTVMCHLANLDFQALIFNRQVLKEHMERTGGSWSHHEHGGNCHICGAHCIDEAIYYHAETNTYIRTGFDCAMKMDMGNKRLFRNWRTARKNARELLAGKAKAKDTLAAMKLTRAWEIFEATNEAAIPDEWIDGLNRYWRNRVQDAVLTVLDITRKLVKYGSISQGQENYLRSLVATIDSAKERQVKYEAERAEEAANAEDVPEGRYEVTGEVMSTKQVETDFGLTTKMVVKDDRGFRVYMTVPSSIEEDVERGVRVTVRVRVKRSDDDPKFGFGSRPSGTIDEGAS